MNKKIKCSVCGYRVTPKRERTLRVDNNLSANNFIYSDAMDCPNCGCQILLKLREMRYSPVENQP